MKRHKKKTEPADKVREMDAIVKSIKRRIKKHPEEAGLNKEKDRYYDKQLSYLKASTKNLTDFINGEDHGEE